MGTATSYRVLLVEDDPLQLRLLTRQLEKDGPRFDVTPVYSVEQFTQRVASTEPFDAVILDYHLGPSHDAPNASDLLRRHAQRLGETAVVVVSASQTQDVVIETLRRGACDFLPKDQALQPGTLSSCLSNAISASRRSLAERRRVERRCRKLSRLAETDPLTQVPNRHYYNRCVREGKWRRDRRRHTCAIVDIDLFKRVNDTHGHAVGDAVLREVARRLQAELPHDATLVRWGGEEFAVVLGCRRTSDGFAWAERVRCAIADTPIQGGDGVAPLRLTLSIGCGRPGLLRDGRPDFRAADAALYVAKRMGRNTVVTPGLRRLYRAVRQTRRHAHGLTLAEQHTRLVRRLASPKHPVRDEHVGPHCRQVSVLATSLACRLGMAAHGVRWVRVAAVLHDIGKAAVPERILAKPGRLSSNQWALVNQHAAVGAWIATQLGAPRAVAWLVRHHHQRFDEPTPAPPPGVNADTARRALGALSLADAAVTMRTERPYAPARPHDEVVAEVTRLAGQQFAPDAVRTLSQMRHRPLTRAA